MFCLTQTRKINTLLSLIVIFSYYCLDKLNETKMKKIYIALLCALTSFAFSAQSSSNQLAKKHEVIIEKVRPNFEAQPKGVVLWEDQFDNASDWILDNSCTYSGYNITGGFDYANSTPISSTSPCTSPGTVAIDPNTGSTAQWRFETDASLIPVGALSPFASATASNGYLFINSDACGGADGDGTPIFVTATTSAPIDLTGESSVVLSFSHNYRWWQDTRGVRVSGDNGTSWVQYEITNNSGYPNDQNSGNPEITSIDVSADIGGQSQVLIQFYYEDNDFWAWYWAVDDVKISRKDLNNVQNNAAWIYGETTDFAEYGRTPITQMDLDWIVGVEVKNDGVNGQSNVTLNADFGSFTAIATMADTLYADSSSFVETLTDLSIIGTGVYQGTYTVSSDSDQVGGANFGDNVLERSFEITTDIYSLDGIDNHPSGTQALGSYGSYSWPADASDGLVCATMFPFLNNDTINSVKALITTNTVADAEVILYIIDSTEFNTGNFGNAIFTSDLYLVTTNDVANGYIEIPVGFQNGNVFESLPITPGKYYAALELYSGGGTFDIGIIDDATVVQPGMSSAIWYPLDQAYSNGNAFAIRLNLGDNSIDNTGISERLINVEIYPNPASNFININSNSNETSELIIKDMSGRIVYSKKFNSIIKVNTDNYSKGIYLIDIKNSQGFYSQKITIQ